MNDVQMQDKEDEFHIDKASKWTVYFLIDLRVLFIITYVYISVIYLISTTANSEANADVNSMMLFNVTSQPNHTNVMVSYIDDALLWSCRKDSVTRDYYKYLYVMLFSAFMTTLIILTITKMTILLGNSTGMNRLWKITVVQCLQETDGNCGSLTDAELAKVYLDLLKTKSFPSDKVCSICTTYTKGTKVLESTNEEPECTNVCICTCTAKLNTVRKINLILSVVLLPITIFLAFMSYDLHALSCTIADPSKLEKFINYDPSTQTVELKYTDKILVFRNVMGFLILILSLVLLFNAACFYFCNSIIINNMKPHVKVYLNKMANLNQTQDHEVDAQLDYEETDV